MRTPPALLVAERASDQVAQADDELPAVRCDGSSAE